MELSAGRKIVSFDISSHFQPLGFLQRDKLNFDLFDRDGDVAGLPLVAARLYHDAGVSELLASHDFLDAEDGANRGLTQAVVRHSASLGTVDLSALYRYVHDSDVAGYVHGLGLAATASTADLVLYGATLLQSDNLRIDKRLAGSLATGASRVSFGPTAQILFGISGSPEALRGATLALEFFFDGAGLTEEERRAFGYRRSAGPLLGRNFAAASCVRPGRAVDVTVSAVGSFGDGSALLSASVVGRRGDVDLELSVAHGLGPAGGEFTRASTRIGLATRVYF